MTNRLSQGLGALAVTALLTAGVATGVASVATADGASPSSAPCAQRQAQVDRAVAKLERLQDVFNHNKRDLKKAERAAARADTAREKKHAKIDVADAKADVAETAKIKRAQVQRLTRAQQRLADCQAGTTVPTDPSSSATA